MRNSFLILSFLLVLLSNNLTAQIKKGVVILDTKYYKDFLFPENYLPSSPNNVLSATVFTTNNWAFGGQLFFNGIRGGFFTGIGVSARYYIQNDLELPFFWENDLEITLFEDYSIANDLKFGLDYFLNPEIALESYTSIGLSKNKYLSNSGNVGASFSLGTTLKFILPNRKRSKKKKTKEDKSIFQRGVFSFNATNNEVLIFFNEDGNVLNINVAPNFAIFLADKFLVGSQINYTNLNDRRYNVNALFEAKVFIRQYFNTNAMLVFFVEGGSAFSNSRRIPEYPVKTSSIYGGLGLNWFLSRTVALEVMGDFGNKKIKAWRFESANGSERIPYSYNRKKLELTIGFKFFIEKQ